MASRNTVLGTMPCPDPACRREVWVSETAAGKLAYRCFACQSGNFAEPGGKAHRRWSSAITPVEGVEPQKPAAAPAPPPTSDDANRKGEREARKPAAPAAAFSMGL